MKTKDKNLFLKPNFKNIPEELKRWNQWVCWKAEEQNGKVKKVPYSPTTGRRAKINESDTWADFNTAVDSYINGKYDGFGFVLTKDDPFVAWDLDECRYSKIGMINRKALNIISQLDSYSEVSPSGLGIRIIVKAKLPAGNKNSGNFEVYETRQYITLTGVHLFRRPKKIKERQSINDDVYEKVFGTNKNSARKKQSIQERHDQNDIKKILQNAFNSKNGKKIKKLYNGNWSDYTSQSEADQALCNHLAYWSNNNAKHIDQAFRSSSLFRDKWDERHFTDGRKYGEATIQNAIEIVSVTNKDQLNFNETSASVKSKPLTFTIIKELLVSKFEFNSAVISNGILPEGGGLILAGESDVGKSLITTEWAIQLALGYHLLGGKFKVIKPRNVIVFQIENTRRMVQYRLKKMISGLNITDVPDNIFFANETYSYNVMNQICMEQMIEGMATSAAGLIIADPLSSFHNVNENDNSKMRNVLDKFTHISRVTGAASIIVHHFGKPVDGRSNSYRLRGASSIKDWADTVITLEPKRHENKTLRLLNFEKIRHGKKIKPILLERDDETLLYKRTEDDTTIPPEKIGPFIKENFNGRVEKQSVLLKALADNFECSTKTAQRALKEAVRLEMVQEKKIGNRKEYSVN